MCTAKPNLGDDQLQNKLVTKEVKVNAGRGSDILTQEEGPLKSKLYCDEPRCGRQFNDEIHLANHKRRVHVADKLKCTDASCPASFADRARLRGHMWVKHDIGKGPKCDKCGKKEPNISYLKNHHRAAHGAPKLQCKEPGCAKTFTYDIEMYKHMKRKHRKY